MKLVWRNSKFQIFEIGSGYVKLGLYCVHDDEIVCQYEPITIGWFEEVSEKDFGHFYDAEFAIWILKNYVYETHIDFSARYGWEYYYFHYVDECTYVMEFGASPKIHKSDDPLGDIVFHLYKDGLTELEIYDSDFVNALATELVDRN